MLQGFLAEGLHMLVLQHSKAEGRCEADPSGSRAGITPLVHELEPVICAS